MNKIKNIVITAILLNIGSISNQEYNPNTTEPVETEDIITEPILPDEIPQEKLVEEQNTPTNTIKTWDNHLDASKEKDQYWNQNSNTPTNDWKEEAISLAKEALDKDKNSTDALKSAFFNAITEKIKIEEGEFTASTYALIKEFDDAIDTYATSLKAAEETAQEP